MKRRYTAQEMRDYADAIAGDLVDNEHTGVEYFYDDLIPVIEALRQAADDLVRKKEYEYAVEYYDSGKWLVYKDGLTLVDAQKLSSEKWVCRHRIVRREVGNWEDVRNEEC